MVIMIRLHDTLHNLLKIDEFCLIISNNTDHFRSLTHKIEVRSFILIFRVIINVSTASKLVMELSSKDKERIICNYLHKDQFDYATLNSEGRLRLDLAISEFDMKRQFILEELVDFDPGVLRLLLDSTHDSNLMSLIGTIIEDVDSFKQQLIGIYSMKFITLSRIDFDEKQLLCIC